MSSVTFQLHGFHFTLAKNSPFCLPEKSIYLQWNMQEASFAAVKACITIFFWWSRWNKIQTTNFWVSAINAWPSYLKGNLLFTVYFVGRENKVISNLS